MGKQELERGSLLAMWEGRPHRAKLHCRYAKKACILQPRAYVAEESQPPSREMSNEFMGYMDLPQDDINLLLLKMSTH